MSDPLTTYGCPLIESNSTGFMDLPRELRDMIYHYSLSIPGPVWLSDSFTRRANKELPASAMRIEVGLPVVSRQIREECLPIYYKLNDFSFRHVGDLKSWLSRPCMQAYFPFINHLSWRLLDQADRLTCSKIIAALFLNDLTAALCVRAFRLAKPHRDGYREIRQRVERKNGAMRAYIATVKGHAATGDLSWDPGFAMRFLQFVGC